jgi:phosphate transport system permease protein
MTEAIQNTQHRQRTASLGARLFSLSTLIAIVALVLLLWSVVNRSFGYIAVKQKVDPATLANGRPLEELSKDELVTILQNGVSRGVFRRYDNEKPFAERNQAEVLALVNERVVGRTVLGSWTLQESLFNKYAIETEMKEGAAKNAEKWQGATLQWKSWVTPSFFRNTGGSDPAIAGIRVALLGSLWVVLLTMLMAVPIGVGAAIYLEEYADPNNRINQLIETNINNLAGVPSIIYSMLGLTIFVRALEPVMSGAVFGIEGNNGRTILSAALTMALLVLPLIIINAREAIRAVPGSLRQASFGIGATKWETIRDHVLPNAIPGILTGTILSLSRALGETAPLIVVGASTFIVTDPTGPFSKFTALPIQIYDWTQRPIEQFRNIASAAIIVLLVVLISLNLTAVLLRNRYSRKG